MFEGLKIKHKIDENILLIQDLYDPSVFVLNPVIHELQKENEELRAKCPHKFKNKKCIYCYLEEKL